MGRGWGMGWGKGKCGCNKVEQKTQEAKCGWTSSIVSTVSESIGLVVNCAVSGTICCHLGCVFCLVIYLAGIVNLIGASVVTCCDKSVKGLKIFACTSGTSMLIRLIAGIIFAVLLGKYSTELTEYQDCGCDEDKCTSNDGDCYADTSYEAQTCETGYTAYKAGKCEDSCPHDYVCCTGNNCASAASGLTWWSETQQEVVFGLFHVSIVTFVWLIVSITGCFFAAKGAKAEAQAASDVVQEAVQAPGVGVDVVQELVQAPEVGVVVVQEPVQELVKT